MDLAPLLAALISGATPAAVPDALAVEWKGKHPCETLYEDSQIRVARCTFPPGTVHVRHAHPGYLSYALKGGKGEILSEAGRRDVTLAPDSLTESKPLPWHEFKNVGDTTISYLIIEKKYEPVLVAAAPAPADFIRVAPVDLHWTTLPGTHGFQMAVVLGDPSKPGLYVIRGRFPPHVMDTPHFHDQDRFVTVIEGTWYTGTGSTFDPKTAVPLGPGSVMKHPAGGVHWDGSNTDQAVTVQIMGMGPVKTVQADPKAAEWVTLNP